MKPAGCNLAPLVERYFTERLIRQQNVSANTLASYRDMFRLLLKFAKETLRKDPSALTLDELDAPFIGAFLTDSEMKRGAGVTTRNLRLTAVRRPPLLPLRVLRGAGSQRPYPARARNTEPATRPA